MTALAQRVFLLSLTTSAVILPLLLLSKRIQARYRAKSCYLLWLLLALHLLLPVEGRPVRPVVTVRVPAAYTAAVPVPVQTAPAQPTAAKAPARPTAESLTAAEIAAGVWLAGAGLFLGWNALGYLLARRRLLRGSYQTPEDAAMAAETAKSLGLARPVPVWRGAAILSPMTLGVLRPVVLLPEDLADRIEWEMVLRHELCHIKRRDLWYKALMLLTNAVHWFDPVVWAMCREAGRNLEYCCDDAVVAGQAADYRHRYGAVLLRRAAAGGGGPALSTRFGGGGQMKGRIMNLFTEKKRGAAMLSLVAAAAVLSGSLVACESASAAQETHRPADAIAPEVTQPLEQPQDPPPAATADAEPWQWPTPGEYKITALFGGRVHPITGETLSHGGTDIGAPEGTAVQAAAAGTVEAAGFDREDGNYVLLTHGGGVQTYYTALKDLAVQAGDTVTQGQEIGTVGSTGASTGAHLHLEFRTGSGQADPLSYYPSLADQFTY